MIRLDYLFSVWLILWLFIYLNKKIPYSPKFAFVLAMLYNGMMYIIMCYEYWGLGKGVGLFLWCLPVVILFVKVWPLYLVHKDAYRKKDMVFTCGLFLVYLLWMGWNQQSVIEIYTRLYESFLYNNAENPFAVLFSFR